MVAHFNLVLEQADSLSSNFTPPTIKKEASHALLIKKNQACRWGACWGHK